MRPHCFFVVAESAECGIQSVLAHRPSKASHSGKDKTSRTREWLELAKNCDRLFRERDDGLLAHLHSRCRDAPWRMRAVEIEFRPVGFPKFARSNKQRWGEAKRPSDRECTP